MFNCSFGGFGFRGLGMWLPNILFWGLIVVGVVFVLKMMAGDKESHSKDSNNSTALEILERRYAQGEIDKEEFREKKEELNY